MVFSKRGFTIEKSLLLPADVVEMGEIINSFVTDGSADLYYEDERLIRIENFMHLSARLGDIVVNSFIYTKLKEFLMDDIVLFKEKVNFKLKNSRPDWIHQDAQASWNDILGTRDLITVSIPLDKCMVENACLWFWNKDKPSPYHEFFKKGEKKIPLTWDNFDKKDFIPALADPGDVFFHDAYAVHYSEEQKSDFSRRILFLTYNRASDGDHREKYYSNKLKDYPPNSLRKKEKEYTYKV